MRKISSEISYTECHVRLAYGKLVELAPASQAVVAHSVDLSTEELAKFYGYF